MSEMSSLSSSKNQLNYKKLLGFLSTRTGVSSTIHQPASLGRSLLQALLAALFWLALAYLALEFGLRITGKADSQRVDQTSFPQVLGDLKPNQDLQSREIPHMAYHIRTNSQGFRGPELLASHQVDQRILMLGDSFVFGQYVNEEQTLSAQTLGFLQTSPGAPRFEVINAGRCGYSIDDELSYYQEKGHRLNSSTVVLVYTVGDEVEKAGGWRQRKQSLERGKFRSSRSPMLWLDRLLRKSAAIYWLQERYWIWLLHSGYTVDPHARISFYSPYEKPLSPEYRQALAAYREELAKLRDAVRANHAEFILVLFPSYMQLDPKGEREVFDILLGFAKELNIPTLDLMPALKNKASVEQLYYSPENNHPRPLAYEESGKELAAFLLSRLPFQPSPDPSHP